jgi:hypothetical protein
MNPKGKSLARAAGSQVEAPGTGFGCFAHDLDADGLAIQWMPGSSRLVAVQASKLASKLVCLHTSPLA